MISTVVQVRSGPFLPRGIVAMSEYQYYEFAAIDDRSRMKVLTTSTQTESQYAIRER
jgi:hypothetical protein